MGKITCIAAINLKWHGADIGFSVHGESVDDTLAAEDGLQQLRERGATGYPDPEPVTDQEARDE